MSAPSTPPSSVCLVRLSALGDVVLVLPLLHHLRRRWPGTRLTWICGKAVFPVLRGLAGDGIELVPIEKPQGILSYWRLRRQFRGRRFDAVLCLQASWRANWIYPLLRSRRRIGYGPDRAKDLHGWFVDETLPPAAPHLVDGFLQFAVKLGLPLPDRVEWGLPVEQEARESVRSRLPTQAFLAVNPCTSKPERDWPVERLSGVIGWVRERFGLATVLVGGTSGREVAVAEELGRRQPGAINLIGRTSLPEMVAVLERCRALLAPDTAAVHIANALGRPVVGLYAVAPSDRTGPYGNAGYCVDVYEQALRQFLGRSRTEVPWAQRVHHPGGMLLITEEAVREQLARVLA